MSTLLAVFVIGAVVEHRFDVEHATVISALTGFVILAGSIAVTRRRMLAQLPCVECGAMPLEHFTDGDGRIILVCHTCRIEWVTGLRDADEGSADTDG